MIEILALDLLLEDKFLMQLFGNPKHGGFKNPQ
jgi:hypothetical protein